MRDYMDRRITRPPTYKRVTSPTWGVPYAHVKHHKPTFERIYYFVDLFDLLIMEFFFKET